MTLSTSADHALEMTVYAIIDAHTESGAGQPSTNLLPAVGKSYIKRLTVSNPTGAELDDLPDGEYLVVVDVGIYLLYGSGTGRLSYTVVQYPFCLIKSDSPTKGLTFAPAEDGKSYTLTGVGTWRYDPEGGVMDPVIPNTYNGLPVTAIDPDAFRDVEVPYITIPRSITHVGTALHAGTYVRQITDRGTIEEWRSVSVDLHFPNGSVLEGVNCRDGFIG